MLTFLDNFEFDIQRDENLRKKYADLSPKDILSNITKHDFIVYERILSEEFWDAYVSQRGDVQIWSRQSRNLHYSMMELPEYWEVRAKEYNGMVVDCGEIKANIYFFSPVIERIVKNVDWLNQDGTILKTDHYNRRGQKYAVTSLQLVSYQANGTEILLHTHSNDTVIEYSTDGHVKYCDTTLKTFTARILNAIAKDGKEEVSLVTHDEASWKELLGDDTHVSICV